jgi:hypothetical protein
MQRGENGSKNIQPVFTITNYWALHERKLCSISRMTDQILVTVYCACSVNTNNISMWICEV